MAFLATVGFGAAIGWVVAHRRAGSRLDKLQHMAIFAILFAVTGMFLAIGIDRLN